MATLSSNAQTSPHLHIHVLPVLERSKSLIEVLISGMQPFLVVREIELFFKMFLKRKYKWVFNLFLIQFYDGVLQDLGLVIQYCNLVLRTIFLIICFEFISLNLLVVLIQKHLEKNTNVFVYKLASQSLRGWMVDQFFIYLVLSNAHSYHGWSRHLIFLVVGSFTEQVLRFIFMV